MELKGQAFMELEGCPFMESALKRFIVLHAHKLAHGDYLAKEGVAYASLQVEVSPLNRFLWKFRGQRQMNTFYAEQTAYLERISA